MEQEKFIVTAELRDLEKQVSQESITYSRMVELLNEKADNWAMQQVIKERERGKRFAKWLFHNMELIIALDGNPSDDELFNKFILQDK